MMTLRIAKMIKSRPQNKAYDDNFDRIFGDKKARKEKHDKEKAEQDKNWEEWEEYIEELNDNLPDFLPWLRAKQTTVKSLPL
jgi:hypothetical protein